MSVCVCVILCYQPSPNTPPQTHISHFGMMTLPVLASLIMILRLCRSHSVTLSTFSCFLPLCYVTFFLPSSSPSHTRLPAHPFSASPVLLRVSNPSHFPLSTLSILLSLTPFTSSLAPCGVCIPPGNAGQSNHRDIQKEGCWGGSEPPPPHPHGTQDIRVLQRTNCQVLVPYGQCRLQQHHPHTQLPARIVRAYCISAATSIPGSLLLNSTAQVPLSSLTCCSTLSLSSFAGVGKFSVTDRWVIEETWWEKYRGVMQKKGLKTKRIFFSIMAYWHWIKYHNL